MRPVAAKRQPTIDSGSRPSGGQQISSTGTSRMISIPVSLAVALNKVSSSTGALAMAIVAIGYSSIAK